MSFSQMLRAKLGSKKSENEEQTDPEADLSFDTIDLQADLKNDQPGSEISSQVKDQPKSSLDQPLSLFSETSLVSMKPQGYSETRLVPENSLVLENRLFLQNNQNEQKNIDIWQVSKDAKGYLKLPYAYIDNVIKLLDPYEQAAYLQLFRLSWGYGKDNCCIGLPKLAERSNMSLSSVQRALTRLINKNLVEKISWEMGKGKDQGVIYRLPLPTRIVPQNSLVPQTTLIDHDDDYLNKDHHHAQVANITEHQQQVMMMYEKTTENAWTKADSDTYTKIKNIPLEKIEVALRLASDRAKNRPNSFAFFIKEILSV
ncbi:MAG: hypothetical protein WAQ98_18285, partial [Blastocatellia bacterium]